MFDLQRNLLTTLLAAGSGLLVLGGGAMALLMGRPDIDSIAPRGNTEASEVSADVPETGLKEFSAYSSIIERPVFFSDRTLPVVEAPSDDAQLAAEEAADEPEEVQDLKAAVAGIVITPEMKLAMVSDEQAGKTFVLREGMSLEGEQAAWKLDTIQPRAVSFVSVDGRQKDLELSVNTSGLEAPPPASTPSDSPEQPENENGEQSQQSDAQQGAEEASEEARARAEEIRRRVAERRAQLRAEAERRARQRQEQQENDG